MPSLHSSPPAQSPSAVQLGSVEDGERSELGGGVLEAQATATATTLDSANQRSM
jgi:hypothetical protein